MLTAAEANRIANQKGYVDIDKHMSYLNDSIRYRAIDGFKWFPWDYAFDKATADEVREVKHALQKLGYDVKDEWLQAQLIIRW